MIRSADAEVFERCMAVGGVAVFPADTVYGLACEPDDKEAVRRLYALKGRVPDKPAAVMFFDVSLALEAVAEIGPITREALGRLLPGPVTVLLPNPAHRFPLACAGNPETVGIRVPLLTGGLEALSEVRWPVLQSSANLAGAADARTVEEVPVSIREGCDLVLDGGPLPGTASTVVDLRNYEESRSWTLVREGALPAEEVTSLLD
jgi:L-threonylcarbamoyladenylate synthase